MHGARVGETQIFFKWQGEIHLSPKGRPGRALTGQFTAPGKMVGSIKLEFDQACAFTAERS